MIRRSVPCKAIRPIGPSIAYISLTKGSYALVDADDEPEIFTLINKHADAAMNPSSSPEASGVFLATIAMLVELARRRKLETNELTSASAR